ncbi:excalibur calcium-binding domain-containing protein [Nocardioides panacihumi]|uniref:excalibur calcium-binding domain-containing protein n=1 Tax=Nocardioides panacihumi TaxID=400774 RepID=UPI0031DE7921
MKKSLIAAVSLAASAAVLVPSTAHAATTYANCTAMHKAYKYGVAKSSAAASYQVRHGHHRPTVSSKVYYANTKSDRDHDGTACEA